MPTPPYRADQVLMWIENADNEGNPRYAGEVGNGQVDGFKKRSSGLVLPEEGSEGERLYQFFGKGFEAFDKPLPFSGRPIDGQADTGLHRNTSRPEDDTRSAQEIVDENPALAAMASRDKQALKNLVGDFESDADSAFRASEVISHIKRYDAQGEEIPEKKRGGESRIDGWTRGDREDMKSEATANTEAGRFQDFIKYGYDSLKGG